MAIGTPSPIVMEQSSTPWRRTARQAALAALLLAAVVGTVYVAAQDGGQGAISALANAGGEAALERELAATKAQLAREASIISALKTKEGQFKAAFSQAGTTSLAAAGTKRGSGVRVQTQQLDGEAPAAADPAAAAAIDPARQKKELEAAEETHFKARQAALENALTHEGQMAPQEAKWLKWKAAHELYEQAAYKDIEGTDHNRTDPEPEAEVLTSKYAETATKLDGVAGYNHLLDEANKTDVARMKQWDEYLAIQKNRTSLFPLVDKTQGPTITWPEDEPVDALKARKVASTLHAQHTANLHQGGSAPAARWRSQTLHAGEHVEAVDSFLFKEGGMLPMKAGEKATILKINSTSGVDTIITSSGKQGMFPAGNLEPEADSTTPPAKGARASPEESAVPKAASHLHLPPALKGNVVDVAVRESEHTFAAQLARERELSKSRRIQKVLADAALAGEREEKDKSNLKERAKVEERAKAAANAQSVVSEAIFAANSRFEQAKEDEIARSEAAHLQHQKELQLAHQEHGLGPDAARSQAAPFAAAREETPPSSGSEVQSEATAINVEGMSPSMVSAEKAAERKAAETFDMQLEKAVRRASLERASLERASLHREKSLTAPSDAKTVVEGMSPEIKAAVAAAEATFDKKLAAKSAKKTVDAAQAIAPSDAAATNKLSPALQAAVKAAETTFEQKIAKAGHTADSSSAVEAAPAVTQSKAARPVAAAKSVEQMSVDQRQAAEEKRAHNAVTLGLETARAAYTEAKAREESRSLKKKALASELRMRELRVLQATATVRALRDALARDEDAHKHSLVAKELSQQVKTRSLHIDTHTDIYIHTQYTCIYMHRKTQCLLHLLSTITLY
jgi:hypothetical protein